MRTAVGGLPAIDAVNPTQEDGFVRGVSEVIGGPLGAHASRRGSAVRWWNPARVVVVLAIAVLCLHWVQKSPCQDGSWQDYEQYTRFCYTDVLALYYAEHLNEGAVPYVDWPVEYPVLTGYLMGAIGLPVHALSQAIPRINQGQVFYNLNALVLSAFAVAAVAAVGALRRRRPWDAAMFALAPALVVTATVNWDLFAVALAAFFLFAWSRRWPVAAGVLLGLAGAAKFYPLFLAVPMVTLAIRTGRARAARTTLLTAGGTWLVVNAPVMIWANDGWSRFWQLSSSRPIDWGTLWYIGVHTPLSTRSGGGVEPFLALGQHISILNAVTYILFALGCLGVLALGLYARQRPRLAQLCFLVVAIFLLTSKVWSQQFVLWLIPLAVLARPRWGAFLAWQAAEIGYFLAFYGQMLNVSGRYTIPEGTFVLAASLRWLTVAAMAGFVVRDILLPEHDVVRRTYRDDPGGFDPDGGDFNAARLPWSMRPTGWSSPI